MDAARQNVSVSVTVPAAPDVVWPLLADPTTYARWSPESVGAKTPHPGPLRVRERFVGRNRLRLAWSTACVVVASDVDERFAFEVRYLAMMMSRWSFELRETPDGTEVTQQWQDLRRNPLMLWGVRPVAVLYGRHWDAADHNRNGMTRTLEGLRDSLS